MNKHLTSVAACLLLGATYIPANAADIYAPTRGGMKDLAAGEETYIPEAQTFQETADWFIRGDVGFSKFSGYSHNGNAGADEFDMNAYDLNRTFAGSLGFGRYVTPQVRLGFDVDYRQKKSDEFGNAGIMADAPYTNVGDIPVGVTSTAFMLSAIYDFAPERHMSPYIGAAVGWSINGLRLKGSEYSNDFDGDGVDDIGTVTWGDSTTNSFAAAVMTGLSFRLKQDLFLDVGYKFTYLGNASSDYSYTIDSSDTGDTFTGSGALKVDDLMTHDVRVGLRYDLY